MWIEIFKAGNHTDSSGENADYGFAQLDEIAAKYNEAVENDISLTAPIVKGHPETNDPAFGWVERLARRGDRLVAKIGNMNSDFISEVKSGAFRKVSVALYPDLMLRHVGFLGAAAPAVKGLAPVRFAENEEFSELESDFSNTLNNDINAEYSEKINSLEAKNSELSERIAGLESEKQLKEFEEFADGLIRFPEGPKIRASQKEEVIRMLSLASEYDQKNSDGNSDSLGRLKCFLEGMIPLVQPGEYLKGNIENDAKEPDFSNRNVSSERLELHRKAMEYCRTNPDITYEQAAILAGE